MPTTKPTKPKRAYTKRLTRQEQALVATLPADFPRIPCVPEARCKLCQLKNTNEDLFHQVNRGLAGGTLHSDLVAFLEGHGVKTTPNSLTTHKKHIMDFVAPAIATHLELSLIAREVGSIQDGNVAVIITKLLSIAILPTLREISSKLKGMDPEKAIRLALDIARAASAVQTADATTRLRAAELQDKLNRIGAAQQARIELAIDEMRVEMQQHHPDLWARVSPILEEFAAQLATEDAPPVLAVSPAPPAGEPADA